MNPHISDKDRGKFLLLLSEINERCENIFTRKDLRKYLEVSEKKMTDFRNGKIFDFWLLIQYAAMCGMKLDFDLKY